MIGGASRQGSHSILIFFLLISFTATSCLQGKHSSSKTRERVPRNENELISIFQEVLPAFKGALQVELENLIGILLTVDHLPWKPEWVLGVLWGACETDPDMKKNILEILGQTKKILQEKVQAHPSDPIFEKYLKIVDSLSPTIMSTDADVEPAPFSIGPDRRNDTEGTWIVKSFGPDGNGQFQISKRQGLERPKIGLDGKEILPKNHLVVRYDSSDEIYKWLLVGPDGMESPNATDMKLPAVLFGGSRGQIISFPGLSNGAQYYETETLDSPLFLSIAGESDRAALAKGVNVPLTFLMARQKIQFDEESEREPMHFGNGMRGVMDIALIEDEFEIGSAAKPPHPLDFAWLDPAKSEFIVIDEKQSVLYVQGKNRRGENKIKKWQLMDPPLFGYANNELQGKHVILERDTSKPSGIGHKIQGAERVTRRWILKDDRGMIRTFEEDRVAKPPFYFDSIFSFPNPNRKLPQ